MSPKLVSTVNDLERAVTETYNLSHSQLLCLGSLWMWNILEGIGISEGGESELEKQLWIEIKLFWRNSCATKQSSLFCGPILAHTVLWFYPTFWHS